MRKEVQIDLFKEVEQKVKKKNFYPLFKRIFPYEFINIRISYESIIFAFIIFILWSIILFSLGTERGKYIAFLKKNTVSEETSRLDRQKYTIQIKTFREKEQAVQFLKELIQEGYKPFVIYSKNIYQICIGKYSNKELAKEDLYKLIEKHKNSFIRTIP